MINLFNKKAGDYINFKNSKSGEILKLKIKEVLQDEIIFEDDRQKENSKNSSKVNMIIDTRENINFKKYLHEISEVNLITAKLEIADILIDDFVGIERKTKEDFVNSIIDKRLFSQLKQLATNYKRPVLIIEGEENIFNIRNISKNVIVSSLLAIQVDFRIPIIFTKDQSDTVQNLIAIAKRRAKLNKNLQVSNLKSSKSQNEELENFVGNIPKINLQTSKKILSHFKSIEKLVNSKREEIENCEGVGKIRADFLYDFFRREYKNN